MTSLRARLLAAASAVLAAFFVLTAAVLDRAFRDSTLQAQRDKLEGLVYSLLAAARTDANGDLTVEPNDISDRRLVQPASGLQAALFDENGHLVWTSAEFLEVPPPRMPDVGQWSFHQLLKPPVFSLSYGLRWIDLQDDPKRYTFVVLEDASSYERQLRTYLRELWLGLVAAAGGLLLVQYLVLRWGLAPVRRLVNELHAVERGDRAEIHGAYPDELLPLTQGLNAMIRSERSQQTRYRNALGDLAHSLKTPLAVLRGISEDETRVPEEMRRPLREQVGVMQQITDYQLRKAATAGRRTLAEPVAPAPIAAKISQALSKVYADREIKFELVAPPQLRMRADSGDLFEMLGNLMDNACKYGGHRVRVRFTRDAQENVIEVEDDGPGFPDEAQELLQRGVRADIQKPGQGIGLAAVYEVVKAYEGRIELGRSDWGGARVTVRLPG
jgi:two-component system, OmpR family, sensor histidine kinase PhoQ